jgi:hypothetical protein
MAARRPRPCAGRSSHLRNWRRCVPSSGFPLYGPSRLPPGIEWQGVAVTRFARSGEVFSVSLNFGDGEGVPRLRVIAQPMYPSPYPVWPVYAPDRPEEPIFPEKVF